MVKRVSISVRELALPVPRTGSIEAHSGYGPVPQQGLAIHQELQAARAVEFANYKAEYQLSLVFAASDAWQFRVNGRVDGFLDGSPPLLEEIKSAFDAQELCDKLKARPDHPYWLQLKTYAYIYYKKTGIIPLSRLVIVSTRTRVMVEMDTTLDVEAYEAWLEARMAELINEERLLRARTKRRKKIAQALKFPFTQLRPGQDLLVRQLTEAPLEQRYFLIQAPTGMGKTLATMFPMLRESLARGAPLIYVTPKNSQHRVAEKAIRQIQADCKQKPRALTLTAKARICMQDEPVCHPNHCPYALDYYQKVTKHGLVAKVGRRSIVTERTLRDLARRFEVCPYELSLDSAPLFDLVVGDYNYVIQQQGLTSRIETHLRGKDAKPNLVVDEAHNLFTRATDNLSASLTRRDLEKIEHSLNGLDGISGEIKVGAQESIAIAHSVISASRPKQRSGATSRRADGPSVRQNVFEARIDSDLIENATAKIQQFVARYLSSEVMIAAQDPVLRLASYWSDFVSAYASIDRKDAAFALVREGRGSRSDALRIICCDASQHLRECFEFFARVVGFSATLKPFEYYAQLSGFDLKALATAEFPSPFPKSNRKVLVIPQVSTKLRDRALHRGRIAEIIARIAMVRPGNYIVFFPSFQFLADVAPLIDLPTFRTVQQRPGMGRAEIDECIQALQDPMQPTLILAVQGGGLAEGVDYPGEQLIGAMIVGPGLPSCDVPREILRSYYDERHGRGVDYAYTYPAMTKVVQAAGRVIRTETDRGIVILIDARFVDERYSELMPRDWFESSVRELISTRILSDLREFWDLHEASLSVVGRKLQDAQDLKAFDASE